MSAAALLLNDAVAAGDVWLPLLYAVALLLLGLGLLVLEFFVVSFGLLTLAAAASVIGAIYFAFLAGNPVGWSFAAAAPLMGGLAVRWGIRRIRASSLVPQEEIRGNAGYRHTAERLGVRVGSVGVMITPARPSGRARFAGGECDVQARGASLEPQASVVVRRIDGPIIFVAPEPDASSVNKHINSERS